MEQEFTLAELGIIVRALREYAQETNAYAHTLAGNMAGRARERADVAENLSYYFMRKQARQEREAG